MPYSQKISFAFSKGKKIWSPEDITIKLETCDYQYNWGYVSSSHRATDQNYIVTLPLF